MDLVTFLLLLVKTGKVEGKIEEAVDWLAEIVGEIKAGLPSEAADLISPIADRLLAELGEAAAGIDLQDIARQLIDFLARIGKGLGPPDSKAGLGV